MGVAVERLALAFSDGSYSVYTPGWPIEKVVRDRDEGDKNETNQDNFTRVVRVRLEVVDACVVPVKARADVVCGCGKKYFTRGGVEECTARNHGGFATCA